MELIREREVTFILINSKDLGKLKLFSEERKENRRETHNKTY